MPRGRAATLTDEQRAERAAAKADAFNKLAPSRVGAVLARIRMIEPLANKAAYGFEPWQVQQMYDVIAKQVEETFARFQPSTSGAASAAFSFSPPPATKAEPSTNQPEPSGVAEQTAQTEGNSEQTEKPTEQAEQPKSQEEGAKPQEEPAQPEPQRARGGRR